MWRAVEFRIAEKKACWYPQILPRPPQLASLDLDLWQWVSKFTRNGLGWNRLLESMLLRLCLRDGPMRNFPGSIPRTVHARGPRVSIQHGIKSLEKL